VLSTGSKVTRLATACSARACQAHGPGRPAAVRLWAGEGGASTAAGVPVLTAGWRGWGLSQDRHTRYRTGWPGRPAGPPAVAGLRVDSPDPVPGALGPGRHASPGSRVLYVDSGGVAVLRSGAILASNERTPAIQAGLRGPPDILGHLEPGRLLGLSQPDVLLLVAVLHFFPGAGAPAERVGELHAALAPGSHVVISHETEDGRLAQVTGTRELDAQSHPRRL